MSVAWLSDYFSGDNQIDLTGVMNGNFGLVYQQILTPFVESVSKGEWPIILPFNDGIQLRFYAAALDERTLREIHRVLSASLGSAFTDKELPIIKKATNSSEKVLLGKIPSGVIRITLSKPFLKDQEVKKWVFTTLKNVLILYSQRPVLVEDVKRPAGRILREFFTACQFSDNKSADELFEEIKATGCLSQRNLLFLQFQVLATNQKWEAILGHSHLPDCLNGRIPLQVSRLLFQALGSKLRPLLQGKFSLVDQDQVREECNILAPLFRVPPLFRDLKNVSVEWQVWAIGAVLNGMSDVASHIPADIQTSWFNELFLWAGIKQNEPKPEETVVKRPREKKLSLSRVQELLRISLEASPEERLAIAGEISGMSTEVRHQIKENPLYHQLWITLKQQYLPNDYGWDQWFTDISSPEGRFEELQTLVINESMNWSSTSFDVIKIMHILETKDCDKFGEPLRNAMPLLVQWLEEREISCPDHFWVKLLELLALDNIANQQDIQLAGSLLESLFNKTYSVENYQNAIEAIEVLLDKVSSPKSYESILGLIDLLLENPCPADEAIQSLWRSIQSFAIMKWQRLNPISKRLTIFLAHEILGDDSQNAFPVLESNIGEDDNSEDGLPELFGKTLVIYTLVEGAGRRAKEMLSNLFKGLSINLNHDHVATSALENLAKKAEYFIFASRSAKHQAFYLVTNIRNDLIYPDGKGASSIVRAFVDKVCENGV